MRATFTSLLFLILPTAVLAQLPPICQIPNPPLAKTCSSACILCELDGYTSTTTQTSQGQIIPGYCTQVVHSMGYIGFVAGSVDLTFQVAVGACTLGNSIEMGVFQTDDCQTFDLVTDCNTAMFTNNTYTFSNLEPLNPGCPYFLAFDNNGPAACAFTVTVLSGSASAPAVAAPEVPDGPTQVCPGTVAVYTIPPVFGVCEYRWTAPTGAMINGLPSPVNLDPGLGTTVTVTWGNQGGQLCVRGMNPCSTGPTTCLPVTVAPIPPTILPAVTICNGESYDWLDGNAYATSQLLAFTYVTPEGCDSIVRQQLNVRPPNVTSLGVLRVCAGDCILVGNTNFCTAGSFSEVLTSEAGCDSTLFFSIIILPVHAQIAAPDTITCLQTDVLLDGSGSDGNQYAWFNPSGMLLSSDSVVSISLAGQYALVVTRIFANITCRDTALATVPANIQLPDISAQGDTLTCLNPVGQINGASATPGAVLSWTGPNGFFAMTKDTFATDTGQYVLLASLPNGCTARDTGLILADLALPVVSIVQPDTLTCALDSIFLLASVGPPGTNLAWTGPQNFVSNQDTAAVFAPGNYQLQAIAPNGCADTFQVLVFSDTLAPQVLAAGDTITCSKDTAVLTGLVAPASSVVGWSGPQNFTSNQLNTATTLPGIYLLTATAANGCTATDTLLIETDAVAPQISTTGADTLTCALDTVHISVALTPAGIALAWAGPQNFTSNDTTAALSVPGVYTLVATAANGCTALTMLDIPIDTLSPQVSAGGGTLTCIQTSLTLTASVLPKGSTPSWTGPQNFASTTLNPSVSIPGIYVLTATAPNGCTTSATATVLADASIPVISAGGGVITCAQNTVNLQTTLTPAGTPVLWSGPQGFSSSQFNPVVALAGTYTVTATAPSGCTASATAVVTMDTIAPVLSVSGGVITCNQPTVGLFAGLTPANATIAWSGPMNFSSSQSNPGVTVPGAYTAVATLPNGCTSQATATVTADIAPPTLALGGGTLTCAQPALNLSATVSPAGSAVQWSGPQNFTSSQINPSVGAPGAYSAMATGANGCTAMATVTVLADTLPPQIAATGDTLTCAEPTVTVQAIAAPGATVLWAGPQNFTSTATNPAVVLPGSYAVVATGANGCTAETAALVGIDTISPLLSVSGGLLTCLQPQQTLTASVLPATATILWTGPQNFTSALLEPAVSVPGVYTLLATAPNGCTGTAQALVNADTNFPQVSVQGGTLTCLQTSLTLLPVISPVSSAITWSGPQNFTSNQANPVVVLPGAYSITVTTPAGCTATSQAVVQIDTISPIITATGGLLTCAQTSIGLSSNVLPAGSSVAWQGPNGFISSVLNPTATAAGLYQVTATALNGCTAIATAAVQADIAAPQIAVSGGILTCLQPALNLAATVSPAGSALQWSGPQGFTSAQPNPVVNIAGQYMLVATASNGCTASATATVTADVGLPQVTATGGTITCSMPQTQLAATVTPTGTVLLWSGPQNFSTALPNPPASVPGVYTLTATLPNGCSASATATVEADTTRPSVTATGGDLTCLVDTVFLRADITPINSLSKWSGPANFSSTQPMPAVTVAGTYGIIVTAANGCTAVGQATVAAHNQPTWTLSLGPDLMLEENDWVFLKPLTDLPGGQVAGAYWTFPPGAIGLPCDTCLNTAFRIISTGTLILQLTDIFGCSQTASILIQVQQPIYVPNVFAPASNTGNDLFALFPGPESRVVRIRIFRIFDRWGSLVHERLGVDPTPDAHGWDGFARGQASAPGVYAWYAEMEFEDGRVKLLNGDLTLVR